MNTPRLAVYRRPSMLMTVSALIGGTFLMTSSAAFAKKIETVTVTAPRIVKQTIVTGRSYTTGAPIEQTTISRAVHFSDLNLVKSSDDATLKTRVRDAAKDLCAELDKLYPLEPDRSCVRKSIHRAMPQVKAVISSAHGK